MSDQGEDRESIWQRWRRRSITVPLYMLLALTLVALAPALLSLTVLGDLFLQRQWLLTRCVLALGLYCCCESIGIVTSFVIWLLHRLGVADEAHYTDWNYALQQAWGGTLLEGARRIFSLQVRVEDEDQVAPGPIFLFIRHVSTIDSLLASTFVTSRQGIRLRYIMKHELLWDPCLDIVGHRIPNAFVRRGGADSAGAVKAVRELAGGLSPREGVLLYPEGTRFTPSKRQQIIDRLERDGDHVRRAQAQSLQHVLPPRRGGALALLESDTSADAVFLAHVGFEAVGSLNDLWSGRLIGRPIELKFWRVKAADIPSATEERVTWLFEQWTTVDRWIDAKLARSADPHEILLGENLSAGGLAEELG